MREQYYEKLKKTSCTKNVCITNVLSSKSNIDFFLGLPTKNKKVTNKLFNFIKAA